MVDPSVRDSVQRYLQALEQEGIPVQFGAIFGSHSKGQTHRWSDIDLVVVSSRFDESRRRDDIDRLWIVAADTDHRIEPIPCGVRQWEQDDVTPIIDIARREGEKVSLS